MGNPIVTLERFAAMRAEMEAGALRDDVLRRDDLDPDAWIEAQKGWLARMGEELGRGRFELTNRYGAAFMGHLRTIVVEPPAKEPDAAPSVTDSTPAVAPGGDWRGSPVPLTSGPEMRAAEGIPSYLSAERVEPPAPPRMSNRADVTSDALPAIPAEDPLPFVKPAPGAPPVVQRKSLDRPEAPADSKPPSTLPMNRDTGRMQAMAKEKPILPFKQAAPASERRAGGSRGPKSRRLDAARSPASDAAGPTGAKGPAVDEKVDTLPILTIEQYASLTVDLMLDPVRAPETLRRYHLTEAQRALLDASWKARLAVNASARTGFDAACAAYRAWKLQNRR